MSNEALKISDVAFVVTSQIERAPHWTMFRELTMNALEAAARASGEKTVHWTTGTYKGVRKAVIWNTGPGMDAAELKAATDLACEINKSLGLDENFGVGAKVSSLSSNKQGMRFRSCKAGRVSEVILGYDPDQKLYVRFERELPNGATDTVIDVTAAAIKEGRTVDFDWTEVMLLGNSKDQDTAARPFANMLTEKAYVATALYRRFYRLPEGVKVRLDPVYHRFGESVRPLVAIGQRADKFARVEPVAVPELNITIHFLHDPPVADRSKAWRMSSSNALGSSTTTCCLVHKDEMYSVMTGPEWSAVAPRFGIPFGSKELCVHIELAEEDARPSQYRERLISPETSQDIVPLDFAICVRERMPEWVKEVIRNASPRQTEDYNDLQKELQDLLNKYKVKVIGRRLDTQGEASTEERGQELGAGSNGGAGTGPNGGGFFRGSRNTRRRFHETPEGATTTSLYEIYEKPPKITMLETPEAVFEKGLKGRAAQFIMETGDLFVNGLYEAVDRTLADIEPEFAGQTEPEKMRELVTGAARRALALRVGKATVYALAKRANEDWGETAMLAALSKESLSIAADNYDESLPVVKRNVRERIKLLKIAA
jgi:hypothetical protein